MKQLAHIDFTSLPAAPIKLAFFDLDGTLINANGCISEASRRAIRQLQRNGVQVAVATGRPYFGCREIIKMLAVRAPSLFFSGSFIITPANEQVLFESALDVDQLKLLIEFVRRQSIYTELYTRAGYFVEVRSHLAHDHFEYLKCFPEERNFKGVLSEFAVLKAVLISDNPKDEQTIRGMAPQFPGLCFAYSKGAAHPHILFCNVTNPAASREAAFSLITARLKVPAEQVLACGDAEADLPFLRLAGYGIAMGNASPAVQEQAPMLTASVEQDGVALALDCLRSRWQRSYRHRLAQLFGRR